LNGSKMIAQSPGMIDLMEKAKKIAPLDAGILLTGESGVGKGILARRIHAMSPRADHPFVTVSCPALPRDLLESELFGHEKGAFTGAVKRRIGKIESARGGTLFLDEIGDLPIDLQPKLLSVLQDRQFHRVGGEKAIESNIRLIAATNIDFSEGMSDGSFRKDLYYRISAIPLEIPPLRERSEEIAPLIRHILADITSRRNTPMITLSEEAISVAEGYHWPGNIREMENVLERCSAFCRGHTINVSDLPAELHTSPCDDQAYSAAVHSAQSLKEIERTAIMQSLICCNGNRAETARRLGISEKSIYNKIRTYQLHNYGKRQNH
jgi:DNA-binding NtrC family response regulator